MNLFCEEIKERSEKTPLIYHTFYAEYQGKTAADIIAALHRDSQAGTGMNYEEWWAWQKKLWGQANIPAPDEPQACERLLVHLTRLGALETGPRPDKEPA